MLLLDINRSCAPVGLRVARPKPQSCALNHMLIAEKGVQGNTVSRLKPGAHEGQSVKQSAGLSSQSPVPSAPHIRTKIFRPLGSLNDAGHWGQILLLDVLLLCSEENTNIIFIRVFGTFILNDFVVSLWSNNAHSCSCGSSTIARWIQYMVAQFDTDFRLGCTPAEPFAAFRLLSDSFAEFQPSSSQRSFQDRLEIRNEVWICAKSCSHLLQSQTLHLGFLWLRCTSSSILFPELLHNFYPRQVNKCARLRAVG